MRWHDNFLWNSVICLTQTCRWWKHIRISSHILSNHHALPSVFSGVQLSILKYISIWSTRSAKMSILSYSSTDVDIYIHKYLLFTILKNHCASIDDFFCDISSSKRDFCNNICLQRQETPLIQNINTC